jgi:hypothetical protein
MSLCRVLPNLVFHKVSAWDMGILKKLFILLIISPFSFDLNAPMIRRMNGVYLKGAEESKKAYYNKEWSSSDRASAQASFTQSSSDSCSSQ